MIISLRTTQYDSLRTSIYATNAAMGEAAADEARDIIAAAIKAKGRANVILATGNSQLTFLTALGTLPGIDWKAVNVFHMDEYVGIDPTHPASFPLFLRTHILDAVKPGAFYPVPGQAADVEAACRDYEALLTRPPRRPVRHGHRRERPHRVQRSALRRFRRSGLGEGRQAGRAFTAAAGGRGPFSESGRGAHARHHLDHPGAAVGETHPVHRAGGAKAEAVEHSLLGPITEDCPASILRQASHADLLLDVESAARLK